MQLNLNNTKTPEEKTDVKTNGNFFPTPTGLTILLSLDSSLP